MTRIACFAMPIAKHAGALASVVDELVRAGARVRVYTDSALRPLFAPLGAEFADLFEAVPLAAIDDGSVPRGIRGVTFAAARGEAVADDVARWGADLVLYESFAVIGHVVGHRLGLPRVLLSTGHVIHPPRYRAMLGTDPRVHIDPRCAAAVQRLRVEFGLADASPFSYVSTLSPWLNLLMEPAEWLTAAEAAQMAPAAFFGSLPRGELELPPAAPAGPPRLYAAFGTVIWKYWRSEALAALRIIAEAGRGLGIAVSIGLGDAGLAAAEKADLATLGASVHDFADQRAELARAHLFVTHHGRASTHEAVAAGVPMLSYPFFWDQPSLARRAGELGAALPLAGGVAPETPLTLADVTATLAAALAQAPAMRARLAELRRLELAAIAGRPAIARRILGLAGLRA